MARRGAKTHHERDASSLRVRPDRHRGTPGLRCRVVRAHTVIEALLCGVVSTAGRLSRLGLRTVAVDDSPAPGVTGLFTRFVVDLAAQQPGRPLAVLQAGC